VTGIVFLDRDGTLIEDAGYLRDPAAVRILPGAVEALKGLASKGYLLAVVSNQAGLARGKFTRAEMDAVHRAFLSAFREEGVSFDAWEYCPHHPEGVVTELRTACPCRKPGAAMAEAILARLGVPESCPRFMVGDKMSDVGMGSRGDRVRPRGAGEGGRGGRRAGCLPSRDAGGGKVDPGRGRPVVKRNDGGARMPRVLRGGALVLLLPLLVAPGCYRGGRSAAPGQPPQPPPAPVRAPVSDNGSASWIDLNPEVVRFAEPEAGNVPPPAPARVESGGPPAGEEPSATPDVAPPPAQVSRPARKPKPQPPQAAAPSVAKEAPPASGPGWAKRNEELVYRVDFIGITMGYARFRYQGKVAVGGKVAYHLNVRAWTSGVLSYIYPVNETIDYYLDAETLAPLRQEFTQREKQRDDVATYEQDTGKITYRYRETGEVRKRVDTVPMVYDPVSAAYYFRWRDLGGGERARNVYAGRKVWQISARVLGKERLRTDSGEVDTVVIQPVIRRDGKVEDKGDLKMWLSSDERHVPVRLYAKFRKIRDWTLVGELVPQREGG
jgi:D-glycero-D-manno-heptose 1,7-bisphosphate phosphatase